mgnify:CR=1 FL=1
MKKGLIINFTLMTFLFFSVTITWATSLDFESGCGLNPAPAGCQEILSRSGGSPDVTFSQSSGGVNIVAQLGAPAPPFSPARSATWDPSQRLPDDPFRADFLVPGINSVSVVLGDNGGDADNLFLKGFDDNDNLLGSSVKQLSAGTPGGFLLSVSAPQIAYVEFGRTIERIGEGNSVQFDNFTYETSDEMPTPVPEPTSAMLLGTGLICATAWHIQRRNKTKASQE